MSGDEGLRALAEAANAEAWMRNWWASEVAGWAASTIGAAEVGDWIATTTPPAVLALLDRVEAAEAAIEQVREVLGGRLHLAYCSRDGDAIVDLLPRLRAALEGR